MISIGYLLCKNRHLSARHNRHPNDPSVSRSTCTARCQSVGCRIIGGASSADLIVIFGLLWSLVRIVRELATCRTDNKKACLQRISYIIPPCFEHLINLKKLTRRPQYPGAESNVYARICGTGAQRGSRRDFDILRRVSPLAASALPVN